MRVVSITGWFKQTLVFCYRSVFTHYYSYIVVFRFRTLCCIVGGYLHPEDGGTTCPARPYDIITQKSTDWNTCCLPVQHFTPAMMPLGGSILASHIPILHRLVCTEGAKEKIVARCKFGCVWQEREDIYGQLFDHCNCCPEGNWKCYTAINF
jgi:hypothetical protein